MHPGTVGGAMTSMGFYAWLRYFSYVVAHSIMESQGCSDTWTWKFIASFQVRSYSHIESS